jgi:NodT family efflux transporter outer membrane factor (OMF) lipoprotein
MIVNGTEINLSSDPNRARCELAKDFFSFGNLPASRLLLFLTTLVWLPIAGCTVGPDFKKPAAPDVSDYTGHSLTSTVSTANVVGGNAQYFANGADLSADWWTLFHSQALDALIEEALKNNHDLKAAQAALTVAKENTLAGKGAFYPKLTAGFSASRNQNPEGSLAPVPATNASLYNLYTPQLSISYMPDVFGLTRRTVESLAAQEQGVRYQMAAAYTTLTTNVAVTVIQLAATQAQIDATRQLIDINTGMLKILRYQFSKGSVGRLDVVAQETQMAQTAATLPPLLKQFAQQHHLLAVLVGRYPSQAPAEAFALSSLQLPQDLPVSLPSVLVAQRPDVLQAESNMHSASANIGVAIANRLPNITLSANAGSTALAIGEVFGPGNGFWNIGAAFAATIFDGNTLLHQERGARAAYIQAAEQYRGTVLTAFQNVADTLTALEQDAESVKTAAAAASAANDALTLSQRQVKDGYATYLTLLSAEQANQQAQINLVQAQATRFADTAALFQALGGGWWHRTELTGDKDAG